MIRQFKELQIYSVWKNKSEEQWVKGLFFGALSTLLVMGIVIFFHK